jgi:hypothetical protein
MPAPYGAGFEALMAAATHDLSAQGVPEMKWMMSILAAALMTTWMAVAAQSGTAMSQDKKMDGVAKMGGMDATYISSRWLTPSRRPMPWARTR